MLGGIDPIIIFQFSKLSDDLNKSISKIPVVSSIVTKIGLPPIPIYLSEKLTGLFIESEDKNIDIETSTDTLADGSDPDVKQKAIGSTVRINMIASKDSLGLTLLSAVADLIVPKVTSQEYSITYLHGATTVFGGLLHSFSVSQNTENDLIRVTLEISKSSTKTEKKEGPPEVKPINEAANLESGVTPPMSPLTPPLQGPAAQPATPPPIKLGTAG